MVVLEPPRQQRDHVRCAPQFRGFNVVAPHRVHERLTHPIGLRTPCPRGDRRQTQPLGVN